MQEYKNITMSSLIAGLFLVSDCREVKFLTIINMINELSSLENIDVEEPDGDFDKFSFLVLFEDNKIILSKKYDDIITIDGNEIIVYDYLYSLTDNWIRNYFNINNTYIKKKTKVIA